jgi:hypothetical protein
LEEWVDPLLFKDISSRLFNFVIITTTTTVTTTSRTTTTPVMTTTIVITNTDDDVTHTYTHMVDFNAREKIFPP